MDRDATGDMQARLRRLGARVEALNLILADAIASETEVDLAALCGDLADRVKPFGMAGGSPVIAVEAIESAEALVRSIADRLARLLDRGAITPRLGMSAVTLQAMLAMVRDDAD